MHLQIKIMKWATYLKKLVTINCLKHELNAHFLRNAFFNTFNKNLAIMNMYTLKIVTPAGSLII